jgi:hypothetical protein
MATPSRKDQMIKNLMRQHKKKEEEKKKEEKEKPKDPEAVKELVELWKKRQKKNH